MENADKIDLKSNEILDLLDSFKREEDQEDYKLAMVKSKLREDTNSAETMLDKKINFILNPFKW